MRATILISILSLLTGLGLAQSKTLSARDAVLIALEKNFKVQIAEKQESIAAKNNNWMEAGLFPTVALNATYNTTVVDNTNNPFTFNPGIILSQGLTPNLTANANLFSGLAVHIAKDRLEQLEEQSKGNALVVIETTVQDVLKAYYTTVLQKERMQLFATLKDYSRKRMEYYELKEKYAKTSSLELLQFRNQYLTDSTNYLMQEISWQNAMRNLLLLMNNDHEPDPAAFPMLSDKLQIAFPMIDLEQTLSDMKSNNQNLKNQYIALELQKTATQYQKSFLYPTLNFQVGVNPSWGWFRQLSVDNPLEIGTQSVQYYGNFNLRYNLFNNWKAKRAFDVAKVQEEIAELNTQQMENTMETTLRNLLSMYQVRSRLVEISEENLIYATKAYDLAKDRFDKGILSSIELETFRNNYQNTMMQHYENQFNKMDTYLEMYKMTGKLGLEYQQ